MQSVEGKGLTIGPGMSQADRDRVLEIMGGSSVTKQLFDSGNTLKPSKSDLYDEVVF